MNTSCSLHNWSGGGVVKIDNWELINTESITEYTGSDYQLNTNNLVPDGKVESLPTGLGANLSSYGFTGSWGNESWGSLRINTGGNWGKYAQINEDNGELAFPVTLEANKRYVFKALINTMGSNFEISVSGKTFSLPNTNGKWIKYEKEFITGTDNLNTSCSLHNWSGGGTVKIDNWELYKE